MAGCVSIPMGGIKMDAWQRVYEAVDNRVPDRVPVVPKIWVDLGAALTGTSLVDVVRDPMIALRVIADAGRLCTVDGVRLFHFPPRNVHEQDGRVWEVDGDGKPLGDIDMKGGLHTHLSDPTHFDVTNNDFMAYHHYWTAASPFLNDEAEAKSIAVPAKDYYEELGWGERLAVFQAELGKETAILGDCSSGTMAFLVTMRGMNTAMMDLIEEPDLVHRIMEKGVAVAVEKAKFNIDRGVLVLRLNDSVGNMSVMSPAHWREFVFPHMRDFCSEVHRYSDAARIYCHICGNVLPIAEDLVETGLDCIGPLDPLGGFSPADVRERVGDAVSLMGGVNTLTFVDGTPADIREEAHTCILEAGEHGGFVLGSGCVVPRSAQKENLVALRAAADEFGVYEGGKL